MAFSEASVPSSLWAHSVQGWFVLLGNDFVTPSQTYLLDQHSQLLQVFPEAIGTLNCTPNNIIPG